MKLIDYMNVLEKILEDIDGLNEPYHEGYICRYDVVDIISKYMEDGKDTDVPANDGWISVSERLPEEHDSIFKKLKGTSKWHTGMFEKESDKVNVTIEFEDGARKTTTSYTLDGKWKLENRLVKMKVTAWKPLPAPYKGELNPEDTNHTCDTCRRYGRSDHNCYYCRRKNRPDMWEPKEACHG